MKLHISSELKSRLIHAAENGSVVADGILGEVKSNKPVAELIRGSSNFFGTKRKRSTQSGYSQIKIVFTACTKDVSNKNFPDKNNPQAVWFPENRADLDPATFVGYFKNIPVYDDRDIQYFANSICVDSKVTVRLCNRMSDIHEAYLGANYSPTAQCGDNPLHNSCMRGEDTARNASDFYHNFAGAQIIVAKDAANNIMGRAIVWRNAIHKTVDGEIAVSILDRVYFTHDFVRDMICDYARNIGIQLRKMSNDHNSLEDFVIMNEVPGIDAVRDAILERFHCYIRIPASKWHKHGAPYMDTFCYLMLNSDGVLVLSNRIMTGNFAQLRSTDAVASPSKRICPVCNKIHGGIGGDICADCMGKMFKRTIFGEVILGGIREYKGDVYPSRLFKNGRPTPALKRYFQINKLYC